jgi:DNA-binding GntR family transcriptional regulator
LPEHLAVFAAIENSDEEQARRAMGDLLRLAFDDTLATLA